MRGGGGLSCLSCDTQQPQYHCKKKKKISQKILMGSTTNTITNIKSRQVELYCHSATCGDIQWNEMSCLTGPRCYINTDIQQ